VAGTQKFTRIPKVNDLIAAGVPAEAIPTYCALADYANNKTGECYPKMETLAKTLKRSVRTIQRHVHLLCSLGLIEVLERRRHKGRYSSYLYRIIHICRTTTTTGHGRRVGGGSPIYRRTKRSVTPPYSPPESKEKRREREARRRREGYEWLFDT
jgi:hypothetical protein